MIFEAKTCIINESNEFTLSYEIKLNKEESEQYYEITRLCKEFELNNPNNFKLVEFMSDLGWSYSNDILMFVDANMFDDTLHELKKFLKSL